MSIRFLSCLFYTWLILATNAYADDYVLYPEPGIPAVHYDDIVRNLKRGDRIIFSDGTAFTVLGILGRGKTTLVIDIGANDALRIALSDGLQVYLDSFYDGAKVLKKNSVPMVDIDFSRYLENEYLVVGKTPIRFTFSEFVDELANNSKSPELRKAMADLKDFAVKTAHVSIIGDLNKNNLIYTGKRWIVLDLTANFKSHKIGFFSNNTDIHDDNIFMSESLVEKFIRLPEVDRKEIFKLIYESRKRMLTICHRILRLVGMNKSLADSPFGFLAFLFDGYSFKNSN